MMSETEDIRATSLNAQKGNDTAACAADRSEAERAVEREAASDGERSPQRARPAALAIAAVLGVVLAFAGICAYAASIPSESLHDEEVNYGYVYSGPKSESVEFTTAASQDNAYYFFGSSELSTPPTLIPEVPAAVFGLHNYGINLNYVGEAYDQSLWQAMAVGAYDGQLQGEQRKIIVSVGLTWFVDGGLDNETFGLRFSYDLYRRFCENPNISDETKAYVMQRLAEQGIDDATIQSGNPSLPQDYLNRAVFTELDRVKRATSLDEVRAQGFRLDAGGALEGAATTPPFRGIAEAGLRDARAGSTNNDYYMDDAYWTDTIADTYEQQAGSYSHETLTDTPEYDDWACLLRVCRECGLEPLVVISPMNGKWWDYAGMSQPVRQQAYDRIISACEEAGVAYADFSDKEYEPYFIHDTVHFGWTGWPAVEQAVYEFVKEEDHG